MKIPALNSHRAYYVAKKVVQLKHTSSRVTTLCLNKCTPENAKQIIPQAIIFAESVMLPINAPTTSKLIAHPVSEAARNTVSIKFIPEPALVTIHSKSKDFENIKSLVKSVLPKTSDDFIKSIVETANKTKCSPEDLTALLYVESKFRPAAKRGSFIGLGQMNRNSLNLSVSYAKHNSEESQGINNRISPEVFATLSREEQMPYVRNYILAMKKTYIKDMDKQMTGGELYGLFYTPGRVNHKVLTSASNPKTANFYHSNAKLDFDKDKQITKDDLQQVLDSVKVNVLAAKTNANCP